MDDEMYVLANYTDYSLTKKRDEKKPFYVEFIDMDDKIPYFTPNISEALVFYTWREAKNFNDDYLDGSCEIRLAEVTD